MAPSHVINSLCVPRRRGSVFKKRMVSLSLKSCATSHTIGLTFEVSRSTENLSCFSSYILDCSVGGQFEFNRYIGHGTLEACKHMRSKIRRVCLSLEFNNNCYENIERKSVLITTV